MLFPLQQIRRSNRGQDVVTGATGDTQNGIGARISNIEVGSLVIREAHITFGDMRIFEHWKMINEPAIVIGMDILGLLDTLVIDYQRQELHIKPLLKPLVRPPGMFSDG